MKKLNRSALVNIVFVLLVAISLCSCASPGHVQFRGQENWGATLGYTPQEIRAMSPGQFQEMYAKAMASAQVNAAWADSESRWFPSAKGRKQKSMLGDIMNVFERTVTGITKDAGNEIRRNVRKGIR